MATRGFGKGKDDGDDLDGSDAVPEDDATPSKSTAKGSRTEADAEVDEVEDVPAKVKEPILPGLRSLLVPTIVVVLVGLLTVGSLVTAFRSFRPHAVPIAVSAPPATYDVFKKQLESGNDPLFEIVPVKAGSSPAEMVKDREVYAALIPGAVNWQLQFAGANGTIINSQLTGAFRPADEKLKYSTVDVVPSAKGDRSGWSVFFLVLGVAFAAYAFGLIIGFRRTRLPLRAERVAIGVFSLVLGVTSTLVVRYAFDALASSPLVPCILQTLLAFTVTTLTVAAIRLGRIYGAAVAAVVLLALGTALSGSLLPPPYLVPALQGAVNVLPSGLAAQATTGASYFSGASFGIGLYGLIGWSIAALLLLTAADRFGPGRRTADDEVDA